MTSIVRSLQSQEKTVRNALLASVGKAVIPVSGSRRAVAVAAVLLAGPLLAVVVQPAQAAAYSIGGTFTVTSSNSNFNLSAGDFGGTLSNGSNTLTGTMPSPLTSNVADAGTLFSLTLAGSSSTNIVVTFSNLTLNGSAMLPCTTATTCVETDNVSSNSTSITLNPSSFLVSFANGAQLSIVDGDHCYSHCGPTVLSEDYTFTVTQDPRAVPEPMSIALLGGGILGLGAVRRHRRG